MRDDDLVFIREKTKCEEVREFAGLECVKWQKRKWNDNRADELLPA
jgi:hypothetical protein